MISETTAVKIQELKSQGRTQVWIARELQVSRSTIARVLHGDWKPRRFRPRQVVRLLELWDTAMLYDRGSQVGWCRACRGPLLPALRFLPGGGGRTALAFARPPSGVAASASAAAISPASVPRPGPPPSGRGPAGSRQPLGREKTGEKADWVQPSLEKRACPAFLSSSDKMGGL